MIGTRSYRIPKGTRILFTTHPQKKMGDVIGRTHIVQAHRVDDGDGLPFAIQYREDGPLRENAYYREEAEWLRRQRDRGYSLERIIRELAWCNALRIDSGLGYRCYYRVTRPACIVWAGAGGYWFYVALSDVEPVAATHAA